MSRLMSNDPICVWKAIPSVKVLCGLKEKIRPPSKYKHLYAQGGSEFHRVGNGARKSVLPIRIEVKWKSLSVH